MGWGGELLYIVMSTSLLFELLLNRTKIFSPKDFDFTRFDCSCYKNQKLYFLHISHRCTVLPAKIDNDVMFFYKVIRDLESINHFFINLIRRIGLIHKRYLDSR